MNTTTSRNLNRLLGIARDRPLTRADILPIPFDQLLDLVASMVHLGVDTAPPPPPAGDCQGCGHELPAGAARYCGNPCKPEEVRDGA